MSMHENDFYLQAEETLRDIFSSLDRDGTGRVKRSEVHQTVHTLLHTTPRHSEELSLTKSFDHGEYVDFEGFCEIVRAEGKDLELLDAKMLERRWAAMCDCDLNFTVDFPGIPTSRGVLNHPVTYEGSVVVKRQSDHEQHSVVKECEAENNNNTKSSKDNTGENTLTTRKIVRRSSVVDQEDFLIEEEELDSLGKAFNVIKSISAGGIAGACAKTVIAPLDRTKIIFQTSDKRYSLRNAAHELRLILTNHGFFSLWRGHSATLARVIPYAGIQFYSFDSLKSALLIPGDEHLTPVRRIAAGAGAGAISVACTYPLDLVRAQMAVTRQPVSSGAMRSTIGRIIESEGLKGLYKGLSPTLIGILPYSGLAFGSFETLKQVVSKRNGTKEVTTMERLVCGALAGLIAQSCTYPLDIVRRRMQTDGVLIRKDPVETTIGAPGVAGGGRPGFPQGGVAVDISGRKYFSVSQTFLHVLQNEGWKHGLFKGVSMNWIKGPVAVGISFTTFDFMKRYFNVEKVG